jgi:hypothetical protein
MEIDVPHSWEEVSMTNEEGPLKGLVAARRTELAREMRRLGMEASIVDRLVQDVATDQLTLLEALVARIGPLRADARDAESMPSDEYGELLGRLGEEYVGNLTRIGLSGGADVLPEQLQEGAEVLAGFARLIHAVPTEFRAAIWPTMHSEMPRALPHYQNIKRALIHTGIAEALDAERHAALANLRREMLPDVDLVVLRMMGESDPERTLRAIISAARSAPSAALSSHTVTELLNEAEKQLPESTTPPGPGLPPALTPRRWIGWGKIFSGMAIAGVNIAGGIALGASGGPLAAGATLGGVLASCAAGIGNLSEGVGALRGE